MREALSLVVRSASDASDHATERLIAPVFGAAILELLLEELMYTIAIEGNLYDEVQFMLRALIETNRGRTQLLRLYKKLGYEGFAVDAAEAGFRSFSPRWEKLAQMRNHYVHGRFGPDDHVDELDPASIAKLLVEAVDLFAILNNKYGRNNLPYKAAVDYR